VDTLHQPFSNELHIMTGLAESYLTLPSDDVALPRTAVRDELGHIFSLKPETGFGSKKNLIITMRAVTRASSWQWCDRHMRHNNSGAEQNGVLFGVCSRTDGPNRWSSVRLLPNSDSVRRSVGLPPAATTPFPPSRERSPGSPVVGCPDSTVNAGNSGDPDGVRRAPALTCRRAEHHIFLRLQLNLDLVQSVWQLATAPWQKPKADTTATKWVTISEVK